MADLFGFRFTRIKDDKNKEKFTLPSEQDGTIDVAGGGFFGQILDTDGREQLNKTSFVGIEILHNNQSVIVQ